MGNKLPRNWVETELGKVVFSTKGKKPKRLEEYEFEDSVPYLDIKALEYNIINQYADIESSKQFEKGDIAIVWDGARSGWCSKVYYGSIGSTITALKPKRINSNYLYYFLLEKYPFINSTARGVGIPHVDPTVFWSLHFPFPPLPEQERIAAKLDALFAQLDKIRIAMDKIPQLLKNFRQQVLTQAVTGKLTEEWREGKKLEEWQFQRVENIADLKPGYAFKSDDFTNQGFQLIRMGNLYNNKLDLGRNPVFLSDDYPKEIVEKYIVNKNDILLSLTGTKYKRDYGYAIKISTEEQLLVNQRILALIPKINSDFLLYLLRGEGFRDMFFSFETGGVNQGNVGVKNVATIELLIPPIEEQQEIVNRVESLFTKADNIETKYQTLKRQIDKLPQAILHKAFNGELVEQLPTDGDARDLLKEIEKLNRIIKKK